MNRRAFLASMCAAGAAGGAAAALAGRRPSPTGPAGGGSLAERAARRGLLFGSAAAWRTLRADPAYARAVEAECAIVVPENDLKWSLLQPQPGPRDFSAADALVGFASERGMRVRGHPLVWHDFLPRWVTGGGAPLTEAALVEHVSSLVRRYRGGMHSWDVVNEAIRPADGRVGGFRDSPWLRALGPGYVATAFHAAAAADPGALLVYNDHGMEYALAEEDAQRAAVLRLLEGLVVGGVPVHALGIQAHLVAGEKRFSERVLRSFLRDVAALGLRVLVTEMDVSDRALPADPAVRDRRVAEEYERFLSVAFDEAATLGVLTWGLSDRYTWLHGFRPRPDGLPTRPLPLDEHLGRKPAWYAIARALDAAPARLDAPPDGRSATIAALQR